jgi:hypothetical protein
MSNNEGTAKEWRITPPREQRPVGGLGRPVIVPLTHLQVAS